MKTPEEITIYPLDTRKEPEGGMWFYIPRWIVRAYKLKEHSTNMGKVKCVIKLRPRAIITYHGEENGMSEYYKRNWHNKLNRERRKKEVSK